MHSVRYLKSILFISISLTLAVDTFSQNQANVWYFGNKMGLNFNESPPGILTDGEITLDATASDTESAASICDENGQLLFYTNGVTVWNKHHQIMANGTDLWGSNTTTQTLIVSWPAKPNLFYVFTASPQGNDSFFPDEKKGFRYSIINLLKDSVTSKNILLNKSTTEKIASTFHANGHDVWVVMHEWGNSIFKAYLITENGIYDPIISIAGSIHEGSRNGFDDNVIGQMKISPNGEKLALAIYRKNRVELFHFNPANGQISEWAKLSDFSESGLVYGVEFSETSNLLYVTTAGCNIYQFNLEAKNIASSQIVLANTQPPICDFPGQLQLAPDGKIYVAKNGSNLGVINNPNQYGTGCDYNSHAILAPDDGIHTFKDGLPNFISSYFYNPKLYPPSPYFQMPTVFTPNSDGYNDVLKPITYYNINKFMLSVYNRWGQQIYASDEPQWNGGDYSTGTYYWYAKYSGIDGKQYSQKGFIYLTR